ncbi:MAG: hypothetical protein ABEH47_01605 [Haloferacaceae archaeon]
MSTSTATGSGTFDTGSLTALHWVGVALALVSGVIHLVIGVRFFPGAQPVAFVLAGLGFFGAVVLLLRNYRRRLLYAVGVPFVGLQIVLWFLLNQRAQPAVSPVEAVDKVAQVLLIVILVVLYRRES